MRRIQATPSEYLVVSRRGALHNRGLGGRAWLWPWLAAVRVPGSKQEACFAMTQETRDGIPLRFKGEVLFRIADPLTAAASFDFGDDEGMARLKAMVCHVCLGELRDRVSRMTLQACVEERKSTLTRAVAAALLEAACPAEAAGWGIAVELVQIAQVFIVDDGLRAQLEAGLRDEIAGHSEQSHLALQEQLALARAASQQRLASQDLEDERARHRVAVERLQLERALERERIEGAAPLRALELSREHALATQQLEVQRVRNALRELQVQGELVDKRALQALELQALPQRQVPEIARALGGIYQGAQLSLFGADDAVTTTLAPLVELLARALRPRVDGEAHAAAGSGPSDSTPRG